MKKRQMTHNEYSEFMMANMSRVHNDPSYGMKQYVEDGVSIEVLPYDLTAYNLPEEIQKVINNVFTEEALSKKGEYMLEGFSESEHDWYVITDKLKLKREMGYYYSGYCHNDDLNMYMTYTEGTLRLKLFKTKEEYQQSLQETIEWYENEA